MKTLIRGGHVVDPANGMDGVHDLLVVGGKISQLAPHIDAPEGCKVIEAKGMYVIPGMVDMHVHLREPGFEHKETIRTGTLAAIRGGFTTVCAMPNTNPVNDNAGITESIVQKAHKDGVCTVLPIGAITKGQKGDELAEMGMMREAGCVAFSDDGHPVMNPLVMRRALEYLKAFNALAISHCEDLTLAAGGVMNEGLLSYTLGLRGIPNAAEDTMVYREVSLAELSGGRVHIAHVSTEGSVRILREAKARGVNVTAETCPHYFSITEAAADNFWTYAKVNPPLRTQADIEAIKEGLKDGSIDVIATDHAPHHKNEKMLPFDQAPSGISGLETALPLTLELVRSGLISLSDMVTKMALKPARILGIKKGTLGVGADADIAVIDPEEEFTVDPEQFVSKGKNSPFAGWKLKGRAVVTISNGKVYQWR